MTKINDNETKGAPMSNEPKECCTCNVVAPTPAPIEVFPNRGGGISLKQDDSYGGEEVTITLARESVPRLIELLQAAARVERFCEADDHGWTAADPKWAPGA